MQARGHLRPRTDAVFLLGSLSVLFSKIGSHHVSWQQPPLATCSSLLEPDLDPVQPPVTKKIHTALLGRGAVQRCTPRFRAAKSQAAKSQGGLGNHGFGQSMLRIKRRAGLFSAGITLTERSVSDRFLHDKPSFSIGAGG